MDNNLHLESEWPGVEFPDFELEERNSLNVYDLGAEPALLTEDSYQCEHHKRVDCKQCFDWVKVIEQEVRVAEERGRWFTPSHQAMETMANGIVVPPVN